MAAKRVLPVRFQSYCVRVRLIRIPMVCWRKSPMPSRVHEQQVLVTSRHRPENRYLIEREKVRLIVPLVMIPATRFHSMESSAALVARGDKSENRRRGANLYSPAWPRVGSTFVGNGNDYIVRTSMTSFYRQPVSNQSKIATGSFRRLIQADLFVRPSIRLVAWR